MADLLGTESRPLFFPVTNARALGLEPPQDRHGMSVRTWVRSLAGMQKEALVINGATGVAWRFASDEGHDTQQMFAAEFLDAMKESAYFVSIVRLPVVNRADLKDALISESIAGFGADDLSQDDFELWDMPRVIMTPHVSDYSNRYRDNQFLLYRENLRRYVAGDRMLNVVDLQRGY